MNPPILYGGGMFGFVLSPGGRSRVVLHRFFCMFLSRAFLAGRSPTSASLASIPFSPFLQSAHSSGFFLLWGGNFSPVLTGGFFTCLRYVCQGFLLLFWAVSFPLGGVGRSFSSCAPSSFSFRSSRLVVSSFLPRFGSAIFHIITPLLSLPRDATTQYAPNPSLFSHPNPRPFSSLLSIHCSVSPGLVCPFFFFVSVRCFPQTDGWPSFLSCILGLILTPAAPLFLQNSGRRSSL